MKKENINYFKKGRQLMREDKLNKHVKNMGIYFQQILRLRSHIPSPVMVCMGDPESTLSDVTMQIMTFFHTEV